ncbi:hypothetical protein VTJ04DRAFT_7752 [Mycothermus thermophilus]|uniref:uncharacterized protein n=1 Tax=Humicola insolens TaxID=85995 RepID=UPI0037441C1B
MTKFPSSTSPAASTLCVARTPQPATTRLLLKQQQPTPIFSSYPCNPLPTNKTPHPAHQETLRRPAYQPRRQ